MLTPETEKNCAIQTQRRDYKMLNYIDIFAFQNSSTCLRLNANLRALRQLRRDHKDSGDTVPIIPSEEFGGLRLGDYYRQFLDEECRNLGLTRDDLRAWRPKEKTRGGRNLKGKD